MILTDTNINGETQTLKNKLNSKFHVMDIKFLRILGRKREKTQKEWNVSSSYNKKFVNGVRRK